MENPNCYTLCAQIGSLMLCVDLYENNTKSRRNKKRELYVETDSRVQMEAVKSMMMSSYMF